MTIAALLTQRVTVKLYAPGPKDEYGNRQHAWGVGTEYDAWLTQERASEVTEDRSTSVSDWRLFLPADAVIDHRSRVVDADDRVFEVVGAPLVANTPTGPHHIEARLRHVEG